MSQKLSFFFKKGLGQHFLQDAGVARRMGEAVGPIGDGRGVMEIGAGAGALTDHLLGGVHPLWLVELDSRLIGHLQRRYGERAGIIQGDFLQLRLDEVTDKGIVLVGNLPYHISSQIFFKVFAERQRIERVICMVQHEVAVRLTAGAGGKTYGVLSVLLGAFYHREYLFQVPPSAFCPPPQVQSGVIRLERNEREALPCDESLFLRVVKSGFQQRRKMMRNALASLGMPLDGLPEELLAQRAEALEVADFVLLTQCLACNGTLSS